tara:strand:- start:562 stop:837 length:276 start_codon:yes stop_codon:yes gene_type:complete
MNLFKIVDLEDYCSRVDCHTNPKTLKIMEGGKRLVGGEPRYRIRAITFPLTFMIQWDAEELSLAQFESYVSTLKAHGHTKGSLEDLSTGRL